MAEVDDDFIRQCMAIGVQKITIHSDLFTSVNDELLLKFIRKDVEHVERSQVMDERELSIFRYTPAPDFMRRVFEVTVLESPCLIPPIPISELEIDSIRRHSKDVVPGGG